MKNNKETQEQRKRRIELSKSTLTRSIPNKAKYNRKIEKDNRSDCPFDF